MMITVNTQLHGYRQGHQLLDSTVKLSKSDQSVVDRLSDVAGPLRPGELFDPYLSAYPLPSDDYYVLARTWQDLTVPRAGCGRTLSLVIPADKWQSAGSLQSFLDFLDPRTFPLAAASAELTDEPTTQLPQAPEFRANELLEALFLEDQKPVAVFDAPSPELIAVRLLTALWPASRRHFSLSTFALSPRKIGGRNFDLVFAPKDARSKFADWPGRRIDASAGAAARHRWTGEIVKRVFLSPTPWLLAARDVRLTGKEGGAPAALRIALLWDELLAKLERSPSAALGLLDIANSNMHSNDTALNDLQPALSSAAHRAAGDMPGPEAWEFLGAMIRKMIGTPVASALHSVTDAVGALAGRSPTGAIKFLDQANHTPAIDAMVPAIADGLASHYGSAAEQALAEAQPLTFRRLIVANQQLARATLTAPSLVERIAQMVVDLEPPLFDALRDQIISAVVDDRHVVLARPLFASLDVAGVLAEVEHLNEVNSFQAVSLLQPLIERARQLSSIDELRSTLLSITPSPGRDNFLRMALSPAADDVWWLLRQEVLSKDATNGLLGDIVRQADDEQFEDLFANLSLAPVLLKRCAGVRDIMLRAVTEGQLPIAVRVPIVMQLLPKSSEPERRELSTNLLDDCLRSHFGGDELAALSALLGVHGKMLDGSRVVQMGLGRSVPESIINRNIVAFNNSPKEARRCILAAIEELAEGLTARLTLDLDESAASACAALMEDAQSVNLEGLLRGADKLMPTLLLSVKSPVSAIVATSFPLVYRELARGDDASILLKFLRFTGWDRCKIARMRLVDAFLSSEIWRPGHLALTACRSSDVERILKRVAKEYRGDIYISRITEDFGMLPNSCIKKIEQAIKKIQSD